jgi:hypothetical protein
MVLTGHPIHQLRRLIDQSLNSGLFELLVAFSTPGRRRNICVTLANNLMTHYVAGAQAGLKAKSEQQPARLSGFPGYRQQQPNF